MKNKFQTLFYLLLISACSLTAWDYDDIFTPSVSAPKTNNIKMAFVMVACDSMYFNDQIDTVWNASHTEYTLKITKIYEKNKQTALYRHDVDTMLTDYPRSFTVMDGQNLMQKIPTTNDSLTHKELILSSIPDWFQRMSNGKITISGKVSGTPPDFILNPNRGNGIWILPGSSENYGQSPWIIQSAVSNLINNTLGQNILDG